MSALVSANPFVCIKTAILHTKYLAITGIYTNTSWKRLWVILRSTTIFLGHKMYFHVPQNPLWDTGGRQRPDPGGGMSTGTGPTEREPYSTPGKQRCIMDEETDRMFAYVRAAVPGSGAHGSEHTERVVRPRGCGYADPHPGRPHLLLHPGEEQAREVFAPERLVHGEIGHLDVLVLAVDLRRGGRGKPAVFGADDEVTVVPGHRRPQVAGIGDGKRVGCKDLAVKRGKVVGVVFRRSRTRPARRQDDRAGIAPGLISPLSREPRAMSAPASSQARSLGISRKS